MEIYIPYVAGSTALAFIGKGIMNYMHQDNSVILKTQNLDENDKDFFKIEHIENTIEENCETLEVIEENEKSKILEVIEENEKSKTLEVIEETEKSKTLEGIEEKKKLKDTEKKLKCSICKLYLKTNCFSKKQKPKNVRRCKVCSKLSYV